MIFILITFLTAFLIEGLGTVVSVIGLSTLFGANPIIIALAISLDMGKLVVVSMLYTHWKQMGVLMKSYALTAAAVTMIITSAGAAGYLSGEFQKAIIGTQETALKVDVLKQQQAKFEERKKQIDDQIASLPEKTTVNQRIRLMKQFQEEQKDLQKKIEAIDKQLPEMQIHQISVEAKAGPILYIAKAFDMPVEAAVKYVVLLIIFVFDPLAVFLIIAGNFLLERHKKSKDPLAPQDPDPPLGPQEYVPDPEEEEFQRQLALKAEAEKNLARQSAQDARVERARVQEKIAATSSFIPATLSKEAVDSFMNDPIELGGAVIAGAQCDEPIIEAKPIGPATPEETEHTHEDTPIKTSRDEITLEDLRPPARSSLNDVRGDATVTFDQNPRDSKHSHFYKKN